MTLEGPGECPARALGHMAICLTRQLQQLPEALRPIHIHQAQDTQVLKRGQHHAQASQYQNAYPSCMLLTTA